MINSGAPEINAAIRSNPTRKPFSTTNTTSPNPQNAIPDIPKATSEDLDGIPPVEEISADLTADGTVPTVANSRTSDPRTDPLFGAGNGPQSPSMVANGRADETNPILNRDAQRLYKFVLDKISALYTDTGTNGNSPTAIGPDIKSAIDGLGEDQRAALCSAYCGQFTPCSELCRYMGCINCTVGNTPVDRQNPGNTGGGIGDSVIDMRGMVLPNSARISDGYMLLDDKVIEYQAVPRANKDSGKDGSNSTLKGIIDMGDDMKGVVNVFAPTVHVHGRAK
jgi:hypothetical protein